MMKHMFRGRLSLRVEAQEKLRRGQVVNVRAAFKDGKDLPNETRFNCAMAEAANAAIRNGVRFGEEVYLPNPRAKAQFGKNAHGQAYLTFGLFGPDGQRWTFTWSGKEIPTEMMKVAVAHDMGRATPAATFPLYFSRADIHEMKVTSDKRRRHDIDPSGREHPRRARPHHNRLCDADVKARKLEDARVAKEEARQRRMEKTVRDLFKAKAN